MAAAKKSPAPKAKPAPAAKAPSAAAQKEAKAPKPAKEPKAPREALPEQNGVTRPAAGTKTGKVWDIADALSKKHGRPATRGEVMEVAKAQDVNEATVATQYQRWRTFNGVEKAAPKVKEPKAPKQPKAKKEAATA